MGFTVPVRRPESRTRSERVQTRLVRVAGGRPDPVAVERCDVVDGDAGAPTGGGD